MNDHWLKDTVLNSESKRGRLFDICIQLLIVVSLVAFSIETLPDLPDSVKRVLQFIEVFTVLIFTVEYLLRVFLADRKRSYVFSFFGIIDLVSILPFYIAMGVDLRTIRAFRLLRLFRALKLVRYSQAIQRFHQALKIAKEELILYFIVTLMLVYFSAVGIYFFENEAQPEKFQSVFHCLWWAVATLTTVGYGDIYPITAGGRFFTFVMLLLGLGIVAVPAGVVSSALQTAREMKLAETTDSAESTGLSTSD